MKIYLILLFLIIISYILYKKKVDNDSVYYTTINNNKIKEQNIITSVAFIISIHPKHYEFIYNFIDDTILKVL
jgi:hypothetical protein